MTASSLRPRAVDGLVMSVAHRLTERDRIILTMLYRHRVFTTDQLAEMYFDNTNTAQHRLTTLYRLRLLDRFQPLRDPPVPLRARPVGRDGGRGRTRRGSRHGALAGRQGAHQPSACRQKRWTRRSSTRSSAPTSAPTSSTRPSSRRGSPRPKTPSSATSRRSSPGRCPKPSAPSVWRGSPPRCATSANGVKSWSSPFSRRRPPHPTPR